MSVTARSEGGRIIDEMLLANSRAIYNQRFYASFTTSPKRINQIEPMIASLKQQTVQPVQIIINLPYIFKRDGSKFEGEYAVPEYLLHDPQILINKCEDIGPATKILPTASIIADPEAIIISVDDDIGYPPNMFETMLAYHDTFPNSVIAGCSFDVRTDLVGILGQAILPYDITDILEGHGGVLYLQKFLQGWETYFNFKNMSKTCFKSDDFIIANFIRSKGIYIVRIPHELLRVNYKILSYGEQADALHVLQDNGATFKECAKEYEKKESLYVERYKTKPPSQDTMYFVLVLAAILIAFIAIYLYQKSHKSQRIYTILRRSSKH